MRNEKYRKLKRKNLDNYIARYKKSLKSAWKLKREIYSHKEMTDNQKDELWLLIVAVCEGSDTIER